MLCGSEFMHRFSLPSIIPQTSHYQGPDAAISGCKEAPGEEFPKETFKGVLGTWRGVEGDMGFGV